MELLLLSFDRTIDIRLHADISNVEIGSVMLSAILRCSSDIDFKTSAPEILKAFILDEGFVLEGGFLFKENNEIKVVPGCCCGLEDWREWFDVPYGKTDIWLGHDPDPVVEVNEDKIKIWQDGKRKNANEVIEFKTDEMIETLQQVEKDLKDFLFCLGKWTEEIAPELKQEVVNHFAKNINIKI